MPTASTSPRSSSARSSPRAAATTTRTSSSSSPAARQPGRRNPASPSRNPVAAFFPEHVSNTLASTFSLTRTSEEIPSPRTSRQRKNKELPPLFWYMEAGEWKKAEERVRRHPREVKTWATIKTKSDSSSEGSTGSSGGTKRLALHHACFKLRSAGSAPPPEDPSEEDPFVQACRFVMILVGLYPEAARQRETRHGCLPLHLAAFASCANKVAEDGDTGEDSSSTGTSHAAALGRPAMLSRRAASDATTGTTTTQMTAVHAEESEGMNHPSSNKDGQHRRTGSAGARFLSQQQQQQQTGLVTVRTLNPKINPKREAMAVQVINCLLDAYPKAIRMDSEGGRLPLHTACAGRATPRVVATLVTAYPAAARHRNKDGFLPLHLAAHWGVSHPNVAITLLKAYPDATVGRNRWERTPLEEALCMAGENGRPHQSALVRALRKHPSFWTQPVSDLFGRPDQAQRGLSTAVDVDESLPDTTTEGSSKDLYSPSPREKAILDESEFGQEMPLNEATASGNVAVGGIMGRLGLGKKANYDPRIVTANDLDTPLHTLIQNRKWNVIPERIHANPLEPEEELKVMTRGGFMASTGFTALHYACERNPPLAVVEALIAAYPMAVLTRCMPGGCLPLHVACTWQCTPDIIDALLSADQGGARVRDELGNVALHSACFSGADIGVVVSLLQAHPKAVVARNHQGSRPIDVCKRLRHDNRKLVMSVLSREQENLVHGGSRSSGTFGDLAQQAMELNHRHGTPRKGFQSDDINLEDTGMAVEVAFQQSDNQEDLQWI